jgi:hypothetical protein
MEGQRYRCKHCGKVVIRLSDKAWVKSYCSQTGREVHLRRIDWNAVIRVPARAGRNILRRTS